MLHTILGETGTIIAALVGLVGSMGGLLGVCLWFMSEL